MIMRGYCRCEKVCVCRERESGEYRSVGGVASAIVLWRFCAIISLPATTDTPRYVALYTLISPHRRTRHLNKSIHQLDLSNHLAHHHTRIYTLARRYPPSVYSAHALSLLSCSTCGPHS